MGDNLATLGHFTESKRVISLDRTFYTYFHFLFGAMLSSPSDLRPLNVVVLFLFLSEQLSMLFSLILLGVSAKGASIRIALPLCISRVDGVTL